MTEALRYNEGKPMLAYFMRSFPRMVEAIARVKEMGATKYSDGNWRLGNKPDDEYWNSMFRHLNYIFGGEMYDSDTGCLHLAHAVWNMCALLELNYHDLPAIDEEIWKERAMHWAEQKRIREATKETEDDEVLPGPCPTCEAGGEHLADGRTRCYTCDSPSELDIDPATHPSYVAAGCCCDEDGMRKHYEGEELPDGTPVYCGRDGQMWVKSEPETRITGPYEMNTPVAAPPMCENGVCSHCDEEFCEGRMERQRCREAETSVKGDRTWDRFPPSPIGNIRFAIKDGEDSVPFKDLIAKYLQPHILRQAQALDKKTVKAVDKIMEDMDQGARPVGEVMEDMDQLGIDEILRRCAVDKDGNSLYTGGSE